jgi:transposase
VAFLTELVAHRRRGQEMHVILDNLSAHKTKQVEAFLQEHPTVRLHVTPTYASWLNQVELWLAKIERDLRYIRHYNKTAKPVKWKYADPRHRITPTLPVTVH